MVKDGTAPDVVVHAMASGATLAAALRQFPARFPAEEIALVEAGEETGTLDVVLDRLAVIQARRREAFAKFKRGMMYPLLIFHLAAFAMPIGLVTMWTGKLQIALCLTITILIVGITWFLVGVLFVQWRDARKRERIRGWVGRIPGFGASLRHRQRAMFDMVLEAGYESGLKLDRAVRLAGSAGQLPEADVVAQRIGDGSTLGEALARSSILPADHVARLSTAERAGDLSAEFRRLADYEFDEAEASLATAVGFLSKGFYVLMAIAVAVYALMVMSNAFSGLSQL